MTEYVITLAPMHEEDIYTYMTVPAETPRVAYDRASAFLGDRARFIIGVFAPTGVVGASDGAQRGGAASIPGGGTVTVDTDKSAVTVYGGQEE